MNLRHLRAFAAIVEGDGFARAAAKLHLSQPALSRQMQSLEDELGLRLFQRIGRRAQLTAEGQDLLRGARRVLAEAESLGERARTLKSGDVGILKVGATPPTLESIVCPFLKQYLPRHPRVEVELVEEGGARIPDRLERGDMQIACMPAGDARFVGRLLGPQHLAAVLCGGHRLARRSVIEIAALAEERLLVLREGFGSRAWFDAACERAHIAPRLLLQSVVAQTIIELATAGYGIAIVPSTARISTRADCVRPLVHRGESIGRWQMIAWLPDRFMAPYAKEFVDELVAYTRREYPGLAVARRAPPLQKPRNFRLST